MASKRPTTVEEYIRAAPAQGQAHLRALHAILASVAPKAEQLIKWGNPFFVEPRFLFAYSAHKGHMSFAPSASALKHFSSELAGYSTTANFLRIGYDEKIPEALVRRIAKYQLAQVKQRTDSNFWGP